MTDRADAHIHLFDGGFQGGSFTKRLGVRIDEAALYASLAQDHHVRKALIVGYEGAEWAVGNNTFLARKATELAWVAPVAYVDPARPPSLDVLEHFRAQKFVGFSLYIFGEERVAALQRIPKEVWAWLTRHRWLVSVNSKSKDWAAWQPILREFGELRVLVSHLGLPPQVSAPPTPAQAREAMADVLALAAFPGPRVKLSGFYALTDPGYDFPHEAAWPYVSALIETFDVSRLLWGSDFTPCLDSLTFPQTLGLFSRIKALNAEDRRRIEGGNLLALLDQVS